MLIVGFAVVLAVVFAVAAAGKIASGAFAEFERSLGLLWPGRRRLEPPVRRVLAVAVVVAEAAVTAALAIGAVVAALPPGSTGWAGAGFAGASLLMLAFTVGQVSVLRRGQVVACSCFGRSSSAVGPVSLVRNLLLLALGAAGLVLSVLGVGEVTPVAPLPAVLAGAVLGLLLVNLEEIVELFRPLPASTHSGG